MWFTLTLKRILPVILYLFFTDVDNTFKLEVHPEELIEVKCFLDSLENCVFLQINAKCMERIRRQCGMCSAPTSDCSGWSSQSKFLIKTHLNGYLRSGEFAC